MSQSKTHFDSTSLLIVKPEIENIIKNVENAVTSLVEDGSMPFGIDDALVTLEQAADVFRLIEQNYLGKLTELTAKVMHKVIDDSQQNTLKESDVAAMSEATIIIKRYVNFLAVGETTAPQFLVPAMNRLEMALGLPLSREGEFLAPHLEAMLPSIQHPQIENLPESQYVSRLYRLSLLNILKNKDTELDFQAIALCAKYATKKSEGLSNHPYWSFACLALENLDNIILTEPRLRVLTNFERQLSSFLQNPKLFSATSKDYADVLGLCLSQDDDVALAIRKQLPINDEILSDGQIEVLSRQLFGPDLNTVQTVVSLLSEYLQEIQHKLELSQSGLSDEERQAILERLEETARVLDVINLNDAAKELYTQAQKIKDNELDFSNAKHANEMINSLLFATNSLQILERNYTPNRLKSNFHNTKITLAKVEEAQNVLANEARISLQQVNDNVVRYAQTQEIEDLYPVPELLQSVSGALLFMEARKLSSHIQQIADTLESKVIEPKQSLNAEQLALLANAIVTADVYFEQVQAQQPQIERTVRLGQESLVKFEKSLVS
ncbi:MULTISPECIES: hypothetical protein [unclassified Acinetobacter]|uniref:hypothetical protein n=1 Tax=unclassified Acinetobacter TaxID=196816 RepID=UPI0035BAC162